jgi:hypothetical protein
MAETPRCFFIFNQTLAVWTTEIGRRAFDYGAPSSTLPPLESKTPKTVLGVFNENKYLLNLAEDAGRLKIWPEGLFQRAR